MTNISRECAPVVFAVVVLVATLGGVATVAIPVAASSNATLSTTPDDPGAVATHRATVTVGSCEAGDSLNKLRVDYSVGEAPADVSEVGPSDIQRIGIDTDGDGTIDTNTSDDLSSVSAANNGHTLNLGFGGSYSLYEGQTVIVEFASVTNPDTAGTFDVNVSLNYQSDPVCPSTAALTINRSSADTSITADPSTAGAQTTHTVSRTVGSNTQGTALTEFTVDYTATNATGVSKSEVTTAGLDTDSDSGIETDLRDSLTGLTVTDGGTTVTFSFDGTHSLDSGDRLVLAYGVTNPATAGDYTVSTGLNGTTVSTTLSVSPDSDSNATLTADPTTAGASSVHTATIGVEQSDVGDSLNKLRIDYSGSSTPADISDVGSEDIQRVGIDTNGDGTIDTSVGDDLSSVSGTNNGHTLTLGFGGSYSLAEGDTVIVTYGNVTNPSTTGTFEVGVSLNYQSDPVTQAPATLSITANESDGEQNTTETVQLGVTGTHIQATPSTAAVNGATHTVRTTVTTSGQSAPLQAITVDYTRGADPADVGDFSRKHVEVGVDADGDGGIDRTVTDALTAVSTTNHGETVHLSFDGSAAVSDGETLVLRYTDVQNPAGKGTYNVGVTVEAAEQQAETGTTLTIEATDSGGDSEPAVAVSVNGSAATGVIQNARAGVPVRMDLDQSPAEQGLTFDGMTLTFTERTDATLRVESDLSRPVDVTGADLAHFAVHHGSVNLSSVTLRFYLGKQTLADRGVDPADVVLVRRHADQWNVLETSVIGSTDSAYRFKATAPGLSTFAVSSRPLTRSPQPIFRVTETDLSVNTSEPGKHVQVVATVRNVGTANGTFDARLTANGKVLSRQSVSIASGDTDQITFTHTFTEPAVYDLAVNRTDAGVIEINPPRTEVQQATPSPTRPPIPPILLGLLGVISLAALAAWVVKTR